MFALWQDLSHGAISFKHMTLTVNFDPLLYNLNFAPTNLHITLRALPDFVSILVYPETFTSTFDLLTKT